MNSPSSARLRPFKPQPFGRYTLLSHLATGGMGEIYLARLEGAQGFEKLCVIKKILPQLAEDTEFVERFVGEARTLVKLSHGSIAQVLDMGLHEGEAYMSLEYVDGKDLRKVAARVRDRQMALPLTFALYVTSRVLDALAYAHRKRDDDDRELNLVHRDISPQNVLISYEGEVKVIDFGLAKSRLSAAKTNPSIILGKFLYMSPEQARHQPVDRRSDLYAVGLCLYELLSGKNPFDMLPPGELMSAVAQPRIPPLNEVEPLVPPAVAQVVMKALAVEPAQRFQTAEEFRGRLLACLLEIDPGAGAENVSRFMRDLFGGEYQQERKLLSALREVPRVGGGASPSPEPARAPAAAAPEPAMVGPGGMVPTLPPKTIRLDGPVEPLSFHPTPRSREGGPAHTDGETRPGVMVDEPTRPAVSLEALDATAKARLRPSASDSPQGPSPTVEVRIEQAAPPAPVAGAGALTVEMPAMEVAALSQSPVSTGLGPAVPWDVEVARPAPAPAHVPALRPSEQPSRPTGPTAVGLAALTFPPVGEPEPARSVPPPPPPRAPQPVVAQPPPAPVAPTKPTVPVMPQVAYLQDIAASASPRPPAPPEAPAPVAPPKPVVPASARPTEVIPAVMVPPKPTVPVVPAVAPPKPSVPVMPAVARAPEAVPAVAPPKPSVPVMPAVAPPKPSVPVMPAVAPPKPSVPVMPAVARPPEIAPAVAPPKPSVPAMPAVARALDEAAPGPSSRQPVPAVARAGEVATPGSSPRQSVPAMPAVARSLEEAAPGPSSRHSVPASARPTELVPVVGPPRQSVPEMAAPAAPKPAVPVAGRPPEATPSGLMRAAAQVVPEAAAPVPAAPPERVAEPPATGGVVLPPASYTRPPDAARPGPAPRAREPSMMDLLRASAATMQVPTVGDSSGAAPFEEAPAEPSGATENELPIVTSGELESASSARFDEMQPRHPASRGAARTEETQPRVVLEDEAPAAQPRDEELSSVVIGDGLKELPPSAGRARAVVRRPRQAAPGAAPAARGPTSGTGTPSVRGAPARTSPSLSVPASEADSEEEREEAPPKRVLPVTPSPEAIRRDRILTWSVVGLLVALGGAAIMMVVIPAIRELKERSAQPPETAPAGPTPDKPIVPVQPPAAVEPAANEEAPPPTETVEEDDLLVPLEAAPQPGGSPESRSTGKKGAASRGKQAGKQERKPLTELQQEWKESSATFQVLKGKLSCDSSDMALLCDRFSDLGERVQRAGDSEDPELLIRVKKLNAELGKKLRQYNKVNN
ncbi:protein kinase [Myxococcaceae bacterium GXIMD 01537]